MPESKNTTGGKKKGPRKLRSPLGGQQFYCLSCHVKRHERAAKNICARKTKNGRNQLVSRCKTCKRDLYKFVSQADYDKFAKKC